MEFELFSDRYAWTPASHKNNDFGVGYFTEVYPDGSLARTAFEQKMRHDLFEKWDRETDIPLGALVRYSTLYPVVLHDFNKRVQPVTNKFVRYTEMAEPVDELGRLVYNGLHNSGRDPRELVAPDLTQADLNDLYRGCQCKTARCRKLSPSMDTFSHKIVVYVERLNPDGGCMFQNQGDVAMLKKLDKKFKWTIRLQPQVNRDRSEDFPYAQLAPCIWFRPPMGKMHLTARKVCRDLEYDLRG